jgi:hypothetical protein
MCNWQIMRTDGANRGAVRCHGISSKQVAISVSAVLTVGFWSWGKGQRSIRMRATLLTDWSSNNASYKVSNELGEVNMPKPSALSALFRLMFCGILILFAYSVQQT